MLSTTDTLALVNDDLMGRFRAETARLDIIDLWYRWRQEDVQPPGGGGLEQRRLIELSRTPWLTLVVTNVAQSMRVDGYRTPESRDESPSWRRWQRNGFDRRQIAIHRAMLAYGTSYATALPGVDEMTGDPMAVLRGVSPRKMLAFYADPAEDDWPRYALRRTGTTTWKLYDDEVVHHLAVDPDGRLVQVDEQKHEVGVCPVVRYTNMLDLDGRSPGEVEPLIGLAKRINKTTFDRLLIQHFASWKVRTVTGIVAPDDAEEANRERVKLRHDDLLVAEDVDTRFGVLPETPLDGILRAYEADVKTIAAVSQTPTHALTGDMINLSAEALAAARAELDAKVGERKLSAGESHGQLLRLGAHIDGDSEAAADFMAQVTWADMSVRSMAQAADALGKLAASLGVPVQALWSMIPGVTRTDVDEWKAMVAADPFTALAATLDRQAASPASLPAVT